MSGAVNFCLLIFFQVKLLLAAVHRIATNFCLHSLPVFDMVTGKDVYLNMTFFKICCFAQGCDI